MSLLYKFIKSSLLLHLSTIIFLTVGCNTDSTSINLSTLPSGDAESGSDSVTPPPPAPIALSCPSNYVLVPKDDTLTNADFCVAQYEMKNTPEGPTSQSAQSPWRNISRASAITACQSLGAGYDLISNSQWQTLARNIASVASNWSSGIVGNGRLNVGNYNSSPGPCNGSAEYASTNCEATTDTPFDKKRTHNLNNGNIVWDIGGNVYEMVKDSSTGGQYHNVNWVCSNLITNANPNSDALGLAQSAFYLDMNGFSLTTSIHASNCGNIGVMLLASDNRSTNKVVLRGGAHYDDGSGIFMTDIGWLNTSGDSNISNAAVGFRCVFAN